MIKTVSDYDFLERAQQVINDVRDELYRLDYEMGEINSSRDILLLETCEDLG